MSMEQIQIWEHEIDELHNAIGDAESTITDLNMQADDQRYDIDSYKDRIEKLNEMINVEQF